MATARIPGSVRTRTPTRTPTRAQRRTGATHTDAPAGPPEAEWQFQAAVLEYAILRGWRWAHMPDNPATAIPPRAAKASVRAALKQTMGGSPDILAVRPPRVLFLELKTSKGRLRPKQQAWREALLACPGVEYYLARPADWPLVEEVLR